LEVALLAAAFDPDEVGPGVLLAAPLEPDEVREEEEPLLPEVAEEAPAEVVLPTTN
jgi:hypothetical protein